MIARSGTGQHAHSRVGGPCCRRLPAFNSTSRSPRWLPWVTGCTISPGRMQSRRQMVDAVLAELDIAHLCDRFVPTLSDGERQRVHFARCLAQLSVSAGDAARILLLDEPTSSLDPAHQHHVMARAQQMAREGGIVVAVVHDLNLAAAYADRLIVLHHGRVDFFGSATDGLSVERLARVFKIEARLLNHPVADRPLVVPLGPTGSSSGSADVEEDRVRAG